MMRMYMCVSMHIHLVQTPSGEQITTSCQCLTMATHAQEFERYQEHPDDAVLLLKLYMSSTEFSQRPLLIFPVGLLEKLEGHELRPADHTALSETEVTKFRRTADVIEKDPWLLKKGAEYLRTLCSNSEKDSWGSPPPLEDLTAADSALKLPSNLDWANYAPEQPRTVFVSAVKPKVKA